MNESTSHQRLTLGELKKYILESGESSDSYILRSTLDPRIHMGVKKEEFFKSSLNNKREDELLTSQASSGPTIAGHC